jgi:cell division protein FtsW (lipid II flippase)
MVAPVALVRRFRFTEFQLLVIPSALAILGLLLVFVAPKGALAVTWGDLSASLAFVGLLYGMHFWFSAMGFRGDQTLLPLVATLAGLGLVMIIRLQPALARRDPALGTLASRQVVFVAIGLLLMWAMVALFRRRHFSVLRRYKYTWAVLAIALVAATMLFGVERNGARLWFSFLGVSFQPSEILKIVLVIFLAAYLDDKRELLMSVYRIGFLRLPPLPYLLPIVLMWGASLLVLIVQKDLGSALLFFGIFLSMLYVASGQIWYVITGLMAFAGGAYGAYQTFGHVRVRVVSWLDPWSDPLDAGFQIIQATYALARGGVFGTGLSLGSPTWVPEVHSDFIYAAIGEELGLLGTIGVLALYLMLVYRGFAIALQARDGFSRLLAVGLSTTLALQSLIIIGGNIRLIPLTGITLPFISAGGSSLVTNFLLVGLLLHVSGHTAEGDEQRQREAG